MWISVEGDVRLDFRDRTQEGSSVKLMKKADKIYKTVGAWRNV